MTLDQEGEAAKCLDGVFPGLEIERRALALQRCSKYRLEDAIAILKTHALTHDRLHLPDLIREFEKLHIGPSAIDESVVAEKKAMEALEASIRGEDEEYLRLTAKLSPNQIAALREQIITDDNLPRRLFDGKDPAKNRTLKRAVLRILKRP
jgi:hypothetical protein